MAGTAYDSSVITLAERAMTMKDPDNMKLTTSLYNTQSFLKHMPFEDRKVSRVKSTRFDSYSSYPTVNHRSETGLPTIVKGKPSQYEEQSYVLSNQWQIPADSLDDELNWYDPIETQLDGWMEAKACQLNWNWINNSQADGVSTMDEDAPVGLRTRLDNPTTYKLPSEMKINGAITLTTSMSQDNCLLFNSTIQKALDFIGSPSGEGVAAYCNADTKRRWQWSLQKLGAGAGFRTDQDAFGRTVEKYKEMQVHDIGRLIDQSTEIITKTEDSSGNDGSSTYTSIYFVRYGKKFMCGWQYKPLKPNNLGLDPTNGVAINVVVDWRYGFVQSHARAIARIYGINLG